MGRWLVTGGSGFLGRHLLSVLSSRGVDAVAIGRREFVRGAGIAFRYADLDDTDALREVVAGLQPDIVLHAAGRTPPAEATELYRANTLATVHLLDALRALGRPVRVVLAGSAAELGPVPSEDLPVGEDYACHPADAYGLSKLLATTAGLAARPPLEVMSARVFNPIGPGLPTNQAFGRFARQLRAPADDPITLTVGDLEPRRDFIDIRDVAHAMLALADRGRAGQVYHVGTGQSRPVRAGLDALIRLSSRTVRLETSAELTRRAGPSDSRANIARILAHTGWRPAIAFEQSLADLLRALDPPGGCH